MSPVVMPSGYTRDFLDGKITEEQQLERIRHSYSSVSAKADVVRTEPQHSDIVYWTMPCICSIEAFRLVDGWQILMEGSGHTGVGGIVNLNNARVAKELGADMVRTGVLKCLCSAELLQA
jgi:hypothetical protein